MKDTTRNLCFFQPAAAPPLTGMDAYNVLNEAQGHYHAATQELAELRYRLPFLAVASYLSRDADWFEEADARIRLLEAVTRALEPLAQASIDYENDEDRPPITDLVIEHTTFVSILGQSLLVRLADD